MSFLNRFTEKERLRRWEQKRKDKRNEFQDEEERLKQLAEDREKLAAYERAKREEELVREEADLKKRQEKALQEQYEKQAERERKEAMHQAALALERQRQLEAVEREYIEEIRRLKALQQRKDYDAQSKLAEAERLRAQASQQLLEEREDRERAERAARARRLERSHQIAEQKRKIELQMAEESAKALEAETKRQQDHLVHHTSQKALEELRNLIRERYELDMAIHRNRNTVRANLDLQNKRKVKANEILQRIRSIVENWGPDSGFSEEEWLFAEEVKERLLADGKRIWELDSLDSKHIRSPPRPVPRPPLRGKPRA